MSNKVMLKKDIVIPAGTVFESCYGEQRLYLGNNYSHIIGLTKDTSGEIVYGIDPDDVGVAEWFEDISD